MIKLTDFAKKRGISYMTAWRWWKEGLIKGERIGRSVYIEDGEFSLSSTEVIIKGLARQYNLSVSVVRKIYERGFADGLKVRRLGLCSG